VVNNTLSNGTAVAGTATISTPSLHDLQVYGVIVTILLCFIVFGGVKIINKVAPAFLIPVLFSLLCIYLGVFIAPRHNAPSKYNLMYILEDQHYAFM
jgi:potassium/chloride transporter 4/5/6